MAVHTGDKRELDRVDLFAPSCPVTTILTVKALVEGWDCPFAYVLCSVANIGQPQDVDQLLGAYCGCPTRKRGGQRSSTKRPRGRVRLPAPARPDCAGRSGGKRASLREEIAKHNARCAPADRGELFRLPRLVTDVNGQRKLFDADAVAEYLDWRLSEYPADLSRFEFDEMTRRYTLDLEDEVSTGADA